MPSPAARVAVALRAHWAILLPALAYFSVFPYLPELRSPNELCRLHQTAALWDHGTLEINAVLNERGWVGDLSCVAVARGPGRAIAERAACPRVQGDPRFSERHYFPSKAPLLSLAAVPAYAALKAFRAPVPELALVFFARLLCTVLPAALLLVPLRRFLRAHARPATADALTAAYALGSLAFSYAELFMSHQTTGVLLFLCFYSLWRLQRGEWPTQGYLVAGLLASLTVAAEYTGALGLVPLVAYGLATAPAARWGKLKALALSAAGAAPALLLLALYHQRAFGSPLATGYKFLNDAAYQGWHQGGFLGVGLPDAQAFALSFFSPLRGLFALSPFLLLALPGFAPRFFSRARAELAASLFALALYSYFTASFSYESWGWTTGPRHLTPLVPFLLLPAALFCDWARDRPWLAGAAAGLVALSIVATSAMTFLNYIPDSLTNALYQVALPFALTGHLPHTPLSLLGVPSPWAALPAVGAILACAALAFLALLPRERLAASAATGAALALAIAAFHASARPASPGRAQQDEGTFRFLEERYMPRPGAASPSLWQR
jgi:hypothetical protein